MALSGPEVEKRVPAEPRPGRKLQSWWSLVFCLCFYGFMAQMRPGESFITPYLLGPDKNFTQKQARGCACGRGGPECGGCSGCGRWRVRQRGPCLPWASEGRVQGGPRPPAGPLLPAEAYLPKGITEGICLLLRTRTKDLIGT